jgi:hypothetical protein
MFHMGEPTVSGRAGWAKRATAFTRWTDVELGKF